LIARSFARRNGGEEESDRREGEKKRLFHLMKITIFLLLSNTISNFPTIKCNGKLANIVSIVLFTY
jgi:hypothetical protein